MNMLGFCIHASRTRYILIARESTVMVSDFSCPIQYKFQALQALVHNLRRSFRRPVITFCDS